MDPKNVEKTAWRLQIQFLNIFNATIYLTTKEETGESLWAISVEKGSLRYKVKLSTNLWFTTAPLDFPGPDYKILWHKSNKDGEIIKPHKLAQSIGKKIEASHYL